MRRILKYTFFAVLFSHTVKGQVNESFIKYTYEPLRQFENEALIVHAKYNSEILQQEIGYAIYLPEQYYQNPDTLFPVLYFLHGSGGNYVNQSNSAIIWHEATSDFFPETVIVFVNSIFGNYYLGDSYFSILEELMPHIVQTYRVSDKRECTAITGFSSGGAGAVKFGLNNSEKFSQTLSMSGGSFNGLPDQINTYLNQGTEDLLIRASVGEEDRYISSSRWFKSEMESAEIPFEYKEYPDIRHSMTECFDDSLFRAETLEWQVNSFQTTCPVPERISVIPELSYEELPFVDEYRPVNPLPLPVPEFSVNTKTRD